MLLYVLQLIEEQRIKAEQKQLLLTQQRNSMYDSQNVHQSAKVVESTNDIDKIIYGNESAPPVVNSDNASPDQSRKRRRASKVLNIN